MDYSFAYGARAIDCYNNDWQKWTVRSVNGYVLLQNRATGQCLYETWYGDVDANPCELYNNDFQWQVKYLHGYIVFVNHSTSGCLDDSFDYGLRVVGCNNQVFQSWY
ncbi:RICIN domain-containing protein [Streptomyces sp. NPDC000410]|uniref:RICIN domain-containing protein n=1 Tax=Streptomyces sp. NPDC000410 TaxID=3154254 RepID=UPI0033290432